MERSDEKVGRNASKDQPRLYTLEQLQAGRTKFREIETRWKTYDKALSRLAPALTSFDPVAVMDALHILLFDWNKGYYRTHPKDAQYHRRFTELLAKYRQIIDRYHCAKIEGFSPEDDDVLILFTRFQEVLGPVGASKTLHLLAPEFFTMWDGAIARCHSLQTARGWKDYSFLMCGRKKQCARLGTHVSERLKLIDELEYSLFTKGLLVKDPAWVKMLSL